MFFTILLVLHVMSAIVGLGPSFAFGVLGPMSQKMGGAGGLAIMEGMHAIDRRLLNPAAMVVQPLTGALLIFESKRASTFFNHEWLWISIALYAVLMVLSYGVNNPAFFKMIDLAKQGRAETPEFAQHAKKVMALGPALPALAVAIIVLMVWKPGDGPY